MRTRIVLSLLLITAAIGPAGAQTGQRGGLRTETMERMSSQGDPDLFLEVIRLPDAKGYVQTTFEYFEEYKVLYGSN